MAEAEDRPKSLPTRADFDPFNGCLDAISAWEHFGGLSIDDAYEQFCDNPLYYQEDFMFMGGVAFAYYFPVIERYILESQVDPEEDDDEVDEIWILAHCIKGQFDVESEAPKVNHLRPRILDLISHVRENLARYCIDEERQKEIDGAWQEAETEIRSSTKRRGGRRSRAERRSKKRWPL